VVILLQDYLTKTEFYQYMGKLETNLEGRLTRIEEKIHNGCKNGTKKPDHTESLIAVLKYILVLIAGGFLALGGASWGQNIIKLLP